MPLFGRRSEPTAPPLTFQYGVVPPMSAPASPAVEAPAVEPPAVEPPAAELPPPVADLFPPPAAEVPPPPPGVAPPPELPHPPYPPYPPPPAPAPATPAVPPPAYGAPAYGAPAVGAPADLPPPAWPAPESPPAAGWPQPTEQPAWPAADGAFSSAPIGTPPEKRSRFAGVAVLRIALGVVVSLAFAFGRPLWRLIDDYRHPLSVPESIAGAPRLTDPGLIEEIEKTKEDLAGDGIRNAVAGFYSAEDGRSFVVVAGRSGDDDSAAVYDDFREEAEKEGQTVAPGKRIQPAQGGDVTCGTTMTFGIESVMCTWAGSVSDGFLLSVGPGDLDAVAEAAAEARAAVEG